jgi:hypothetical protein
MANLLWTFLGAIARALFPVFVKGCVRLASKCGRIYLRYGWKGLRAQMRKMFTSGSRPKKARDSESCRAGGKEIPEMDDAGETDI